MNSASGKRQHQAEDGGGQRHDERAQQDREIQRIGEAPVAFDGPRLLDAAVDAARQQAVGQHDGERRGEQHGQPEPGGQQEPGAQLHSNTHLVGGVPADVNRVARSNIRRPRAAPGPRRLRRNRAAPSPARSCPGRPSRSPAGGAALRSAVRGRCEARGFRADADAADPVHRAEKARHEARARAQVDVFGRAHLLDAALRS